MFEEGHYERQSLDFSSKTLTHIKEKLFSYSGVFFIQLCFALFVILLFTWKYDIDLLLFTKGKPVVDSLIKWSTNIKPHVKPNVIK